MKMQEKIDRDALSAINVLIPIEEVEEDLDEDLEEGSEEE